MKSLRVVYEVTQVVDEVTHGCIWSHSGFDHWSHSRLYMKSLRVVYEVTQGCIWSHSGLYMKLLRVVY